MHEIEKLVDSCCIHVEFPSKVLLSVDNGTDCADLDMLLGNIAESLVSVVGELGG